MSEDSGKSEVVEKGQEELEGEEDEDLPTLSADTFAALQQFYTEQDARDQERLEVQVRKILIYPERSLLIQRWRVSFHPNLKCSLICCSDIYLA